MDIIERKSEPLKIGFPTNSRIAQDCAPLREALELEGKQGIFKSNKVPGVRFRTLRAQDIAKFIMSGEMDLGILGEDIMMEACMGSDANLITSRIRFDIGTLVDICILIREEEREEFEKLLQDDSSPRKSIVTPYPNVTSTSLNYSGALARVFAQGESGHGGISTLKFPIEIREIAGQTEGIVRNRDIPNTIAAVDVVKSGATAKEYGLMVYGPPVLSSRPVLYQSMKYRTQGNLQVSDIIQQLEERFRPFILTPDSEFDEENRNAKLRSILELLQNGWKAIDVDTLTERDIRNIGKIDRKIVYFFRSEQQIDAATLVAPAIKAKLKTALTREISDKGRRVAQNLGTSKFSQWLGIDLSRPAVSIEDGMVN